MSELPDPVTRPSDTAKGRIGEFQRGDVSWKSYTDQWKENHGTLLMGFAACVFLVGAAVLAYQQSRFRPPAFPTAHAIDRENNANEDGLANSEESPEAVEGQPALHVRVLGASDAGGSIRLAVYNAAEHFNQPPHADWIRSLAIDESGVAQCAIPIEMLADPFAIAVYQDSNGNGQLDRGLLGVPSERYGFSNAARGKVGSPSFEQAAIERPDPESILEESILDIEIW